MSLCQTNATYNGILLKSVLIEGVDQATVFDSTNVDPIGIQTRISMVCQLHVAHQEIHGKQVWNKAEPNEHLALGLDAVVQQLLIPRRRFTLTVGGEVWFDVIPSAVEPCSNAPVTFSSTRMEIAHGPRTTCRILSLAGQHAAKARVEVSFMTPIRCGPLNAAGVLNLRWWVADDIDVAWLTTRTYVGRFRLTGSFRNFPAGTGFEPHAIARFWTLPPLQAGFQREHISWHEEPNGLEMSFTIVDKEVWAIAPFPATSWSGTYTITLPQHGITNEEELSFRLKGPKDKINPQGYVVEPVVAGMYDKQALLSLAASIVEAKLHWSKVNIADPSNAKDGTRFLLSAMYQEVLESCEVSCSARIKNTGTVKWLTNIAGQPFGKKSALELGAPLWSDVSDIFKFTGNSYYYAKELAWKDREPTALVTGLFLAALQTHCCPQSLDRARYELPREDRREQPPEATTTPPRGPIEWPWDSYSTYHTTAMYEYYRLSSKLTHDTGWRGFPRGLQCNQSDSSESSGSQCAKSSGLMSTSGDSQSTFAFAQIHCGVALREVRVHASRINAWPQLPKREHWTDQFGIKHVLRDCIIDSCAAQLSADGIDTLHEVYARYYYYLSRPPRDHEINVGMVPYQTYEQLSIGIVNPDGTPGDGTQYGPDFFLDPAVLLTHPKADPEGK